MELVVVGAGRLGRSLAVALTAAGYRADLASGRDWRTNLVGRLRSLGPESIVVLSVPDPVVSDLAAGIAGMTGVDRKVAVIHVSGSLPLASLAAVAAEGHPVGSLHPFQSFPAQRPPHAFKGSLIGIDASTVELAVALTGIARDLGGRPRAVTDEQRSLYHAAAVLSANLMVALADVSIRVLGSAGWSAEDGLAAVVPLMRGVLDNLEATGTADALIGPIRRGDADTVRRHLDALEGSGVAEAAQVYRILGLSALRLALESGLDPIQGELIKEALTG